MYACPSALADDPSRLTALVSDVGWIDAAIQSTGMDRVLADLRLAAATDPAEAAVGAMLAIVLGQEAYHLRSSLPVTRPGYVLRQLWSRRRSLVRIVLPATSAQGCEASRLLGQLGRCIPSIGLD